MTVLVAVATRHGATREIAEELAESLRREGLEVDLADLDGAVEIDDYEAVVLGSAVYIGRWLEPARRFVARNRVALSTRPTWLFSSGPIGDPPKPDGEAAVQVDALIAATRAREHRIFAGRVDRSTLSLAERAVMRVVRAGDGDWRDWTAVHEYASSIAYALLARSASRPGV